MSTIQEQLQRKRVPIDTWDIKEKLLLASAVVRSGDQNWMSVSRLMKTQGHSTRPADWYSQKNCAAQYFLLLEHVETPKRKKRVAGSEVVMETPSESILRSLREERILEIKKIMIEEKRLYMKLKEEISCVRNGRADEAQLREMCLQIDQEKKHKEKEAVLHAEWLKKREEKKLELERQWRPAATKLIAVGQKRKLEAVEGPVVTEPPKVEPVVTEESTQETPKPAMSPLLTSLLKSPSPAPNSASSILHSAITHSNQRGTSPTIASLLSSSPDVTISPGIQQLVSTAIGQDPVAQTGPSPNIQTPTQIDARIHPNNIPIRTSISDNIPEIKKEPLQSVISDNIEEEIQLIEEVLKNVEENESKELLDRKEDTNETASNKIGEIKNELDKAMLKTVKEEEVDVVLATISDDDQPLIEEISTPVKEECIDSSEETAEESSPIMEPVQRAVSSAAIREVSVVLEELESSSQQSDGRKEVESADSELKETASVTDSDDKLDDREDTTNESITTEDSQPVSNGSEIKEELKDDDEKDSEILEELKLETEAQCELLEEKELEEPDKIVDNKETVDELNDDNQKSALALTDESDFDDLAISVIKTEKNKRDYSRTKKKEDKEIDFLLVDEKDDNTNDGKDMDDTESNDIDKKFEAKHKSKLDVDRSVSPWTEEEAETALTRTRRRYSTPATPSDSIPNSPASSVAGFDDDREYRAWKKSVMLMYSRLAAHKYASLFLRPITDEQAPGYHSIIREPKDLQTLRRNIDNGQIKTTAEFLRYVVIMFQNAIMYNKTNNYVYNKAKEMQEECIPQVQALVLAQVESSPRRELRTSEPGLKPKTDIPTKSRKRKLD